MAGRKWNRTFRVDDETWARFTEVAWGRRESVSDVLRRAVDDYCQADERWKL